MLYVAVYQKYFTLERTKVNPFNWIIYFTAINSNNYENYGKT